MSSLIFLWLYLAVWLPLGREYLEGLIPADMLFFSSLHTPSNSCNYNFFFFYLHFPDANSCSSAVTDGFLACRRSRKICFGISYISACDSAIRCDSLLSALLEVPRFFFPLVWTPIVESLAPAGLSTSSVVMCSALVTGKEYLVLLRAHLHWHEVEKPYIPDRELPMKIKNRRCQRDKLHHFCPGNVYSVVEGRSGEYNSHCLMSLDHSQRWIQCLEIYQTWQMPQWGSRTMGACEDDWCFHRWLWQNNTSILSEWSLVLARNTILQEK